MASVQGSTPAPNRTLGTLPPSSGGGFSPASLSITVTPPAGGGGTPVVWRPGTPQTSNLNGSIAFLDCYTDPVSCIETYEANALPGLLSREGWTFVDDSGAARLDANGSGWWLPPPPAHSDGYFFAFGDDYRGALALAADIFGTQEVPPRAWFGPWWSQNYPWNNITGSNQSWITGVVDEYAANGIPLAVGVLDMVRSCRAACAAVRQGEGIVAC